jgi:hypothetical protein
MGIPGKSGAPPPGATVFLENSRNLLIGVLQALHGQGNGHESGSRHQAAVQNIGFPRNPANGGGLWAKPKMTTKQ